MQEIQVPRVTSANGSVPAMGEAADALRRSVEGLRGAIFESRLRETMEQSPVSSLGGLVDPNRRMARGRYELGLVVGEGVPTDPPGRPGQDLAHIVREALTNVRDDGNGFDPGGSRPGLGRHSRRQRTLDPGGNVEVEGGPGGGTRVLLRVPPPADRSNSLARR